MSDLLLTWMSGKEFVKEPGVNVFVKSAVEKLPAVDKIVLTNEDTYPEIPDNWCKDFDFIRFRNNLVKKVLRDRWYAFWKYLSDIGEYQGVTHVFIADCKDVLFQRNIFEQARSIRNHDEFVCLFHEGMTHEQSQCNLLDQYAFQLGLGDLADPYFKVWPVLNAGTILGTREAVKNFCIMMWLASLKAGDRYSDQAAMNFMFHHVPCVYAHPEYGSYVVTGEGVKHGFVTVVDDGGVYKNKAGESYCVFHQWDRTEYAPAILEKYNK